MPAWEPATGDDDRSGGEGAPHPADSPAMERDYDGNKSALTCLKEKAPLPLLGVGAPFFEVPCHGTKIVPPRG